MLRTREDRLRADFENIADQYGRERNALLPILQEVKRRYHEISDFAMQSIADILEIHPVEVYGVVTFYAFLSEKYHGKYVIRLCRTISCKMANMENVARQLENELGIAFGETTEDGFFTLEYAHCLGMCDQSPALLINDEVFTRVTPEQVNLILQSCRKNLTAINPLMKEAMV
ncbi:MAG: NAD(P)H-dependent oxidoreductase subunit E [Puniceicoccaceae bacterium]